MGHIRLGRLPTSRKWRQVVNALEQGSGVGTVAASAAEAAEKDLATAARDPALLEAFWLLTQLLLAARGPSFVGDAKRLGLNLPKDPDFLEITAALAASIDRHVADLEGRTDLGEMAQMAAIESLTSIIGPRLPSLFTPTALEVQRAIGRLSGGDHFKILARTFFARLTQRVLHYFLSRELAKHTGRAHRFATDRERIAFDEAINIHCWEASRIVETFAGGWYGKAVFQKGGLTPERIRSFVPIAFRKIRAELRKRRDDED